MALKITIERVSEGTQEGSSLPIKTLTHANTDLPLIVVISEVRLPVAGLKSFLNMYLQDKGSTVITAITPMTLGGALVLADNEHIVES